eukprot:369722-Amphidinium_carterae.1
MVEISHSHHTEYGTRSAGHQRQSCPRLRGDLLDLPNACRSRWAKWLAPATPSGAASLAASAVAAKPGSTSLTDVRDWEHRGQNPKKGTDSHPTNHILTVCHWHKRSTRCPHVERDHIWLSFVQFASKKVESVPGWLSRSTDLPLFYGGTPSQKRQLPAHRNGERFSHRASDHVADTRVPWRD